MEAADESSARRAPVKLADVIAKAREEIAGRYSRTRRNEDGAPVLITAAFTLRY